MSLGRRERQKEYLTCYHIVCVKGEERGVRRERGEKREGREEREERCCAGKKHLTWLGMSWE